jgi:hypothetical protein
MSLGHRIFQAFLKRLSKGNALASDHFLSPQDPNKAPRKVTNPPSRLEGGFTLYDVTLLLLIFLTIWLTVNYIYVNYYKNRRDYILHAPESTHYLRNAFRTSLDLREYPSYYAPTVISIDREEQVEILSRSRYDEFGNIWTRVRYHSGGGRIHEGWVHALYLH